MELFFFFFVVVFIFGFCLEILLGLRLSNILDNNMNENCLGNKIKVLKFKENEGLYILDIICIVYFMIEFVVCFVFVL